MKSLILEFSFLHSNTSTCTSLIQHDKDVGEAHGKQCLLDNELAIPSCSRWAPPCLLVKKSDSMEDCMNQDGGAWFVSKFDLLKGYLSGAIDSQSPRNLYNHNSFWTFLQSLCSRVYLDYVVCYAHTWDIHLARIRALFEQFLVDNPPENLAKCEFARATVVYLGKAVGPGVVQPVRAKLLAIDRFPPPAMKTELMRFLGIAGYYRNFYSNFPTVDAPLTNLL